MPEPDTSGPMVSVVMATYNGAPYVREQVHSILEQLQPGDEVVIVDDASTDETRDVLAGLVDDRIRVTHAPTNRGYVRTFEAALRQARGDVILFADQDDVWLPRHRGVLVEALRTSAVVASNLVMLSTGKPLESPLGRPGWHLRADDSRRHVANILGVLMGARPYYGCTMGLRREALTALLPFPTFLTESHDLWVALYGNLSGSIVHVEEPTLRRRLHESNASPDRPRGVGAALASRRMLLRSIRELRRRIRGGAGPQRATT